MFEYNNKKYEIIIEKKKIKNLYIKVREDIKIYISCNKYMSNNLINKIIKENYKTICTMIEKQEEKLKKEKDFYFLGKKYDKVLINDDHINIIENRIFYNSEENLNKWVKKQTINIFDERINECINKFREKLPKVNLKIRNMKTRWGVCNRKNNNVTLNSNLIKYDIEVIDYVIFHELCHFIHPNHSKNFWLLVEYYVNNYKNLRNRLKN